MELIKLGGAFYTKKVAGKVVRPTDPDFAEHIDYERLEGVRGALRESEQPRILVCGAGVYGHGLAQDLGLMQTWQQFEYDQLHDLSENILQLQNLLANKLPEWDWLSADQYPVLKPGQATVANIISDGEGSWRILSGDEIMAKLATKYADELDKLIFYSDVAGVKLRSGEVVNDFTVQEIPWILAEMEAAESLDATGGMQGKLEALKSLQQNLKVEFFNK